MEEKVFDLIWLYFISEYLRQETKDYLIGDLFNKIMQR